MKNEKINVNVPCGFCNAKYAIEMTTAQFNELQSPHRRHIQDIIPELAPEMRELFISGMCPKCWDKLFSFENEEEE